jgi:hypothetical protein
VAESEYQNLFVSPAALGGPVRTFAEIVLLLAYEWCRTKGPAIFMRLPSSRPQPLDARHPHTLHVLETMIPLIAFSYSKWRYLLVVVVEEGGGGGGEDEIVYGLLPSRRPL